MLGAASLRVLQKGKTNRIARQTSCAIAGGSCKEISWEALGEAMIKKITEEVSHYSVFQVGCPEEIKKWELSLFVEATTAE